VVTAPAAIATATDDAKKEKVVDDAKKEKEKEKEVDVKDKEKEKEKEVVDEKKKKNTKEEAHAKEKDGDVVMGDAEKDSQEKGGAKETTKDDKKNEKNKEAAKDVEKDGATKKESPSSSSSSTSTSTSSSTTPPEDEKKAPAAPFWADKWVPGTPVAAPPVVFETTETTTVKGKGKSKKTVTTKKMIPSGLRSAVQKMLDAKMEDDTYNIVRLWSDCISITRRCKRHCVLKIAELMKEPGSYVTGGFNRRRLVTQKTAHMYNVWSRSWDKFDAEMNSPRREAASVVVDGVLYSVGGVFGMQSLRTVERYSRARNQWVPVASMPLQRRGAACCGLDGKLYIAGGYEDGYNPHTKPKAHGFLKQVFVLSPKERDQKASSAMGRWNTMPSSTTPRGGASLCAMNGDLYLIGGGFAVQPDQVDHNYPNFALNTGEKFDFTTRKWTKIAPMKSARRDFRCVSFFSKLDLSIFLPSLTYSLIHFLLHSLTTPTNTLLS
jgi:hypothetical protein